MLKEMGAKLVVARAARDRHARFLLKNGADEIVYPEKQLASWTAIRYSSDHIFDYIAIDGDYAIFEVSIPKSWDKRTVGELDVRRVHNINIMAIKHNGIVNPDVTPDTVISAQDTMLVLGKNKDIQKCFHI